MPDSLGGKRMAIRVAELARAGLTPDWMPGAVPRCVPVEMKRNRHGERATTVVVGIERVLTRGKWRSVEVLACPLTWRPHPEQIEAARRAYDDWSQALGWVRDGLDLRRDVAGGRGDGGDAKVEAVGKPVTLAEIAPHIEAGAGQRVDVGGRLVAPPLSMQISTRAPCSALGRPRLNVSGKML